MPVSSGSVLARAAAHLNDASQLVYTAAILLPFLNMAVDELEEEMSVFELTPLIQDSAVFDVLSGVNTLTGLPADFVEPISLIERTKDSSDRWVEVREVADLDNNLVDNPTDTVIEWAVRNTTVYVNPPSSDREILMSYMRGLTEATTGNNIDIERSRRFLALVTARNAARDLGNSPSKANSFVDDISRARDRLIRRMQKNSQSTMGVRRKAYTGRGR